MNRFRALAAAFVGLVPPSSWVPYRSALKPQCFLSFRRRSSLLASSPISRPPQRACKFTYAGARKPGPGAGLSRRRRPNCSTARAQSSASITRGQPGGTGRRQSRRRAESLGCRPGGERYFLASARRQIARGRRRVHRGQGHYTRLDRRRRSAFHRLRRGAYGGRSPHRLHSHLLLPEVSPTHMADHFDGKRYFNPQVDIDRSLGELLRWRMSRRPVPWPQPAPCVAPPPAPAVDDGRIVATYIGQATFLVRVRRL